MNFDEWEPGYKAILESFDYQRSGDEHARDVAAELATPFDHDRLNVFRDATVAVAGGASCLSDPSELTIAQEADIVVAASTAVDVLYDAGIGVDLMVTDLDKNPETARDLTDAGTPVAAHAHGDNVPAVRKWLPAFASDATIATTQAAPVGSVYNFGGFTDGDRGAFIADHFGAAELQFPGWEFDDPSVDDMKGRKLAWAARLLHWLERRRGEQFPVLDGRRSSISLPWIDDVR